MLEYKLGASLSIIELYLRLSLALGETCEKQLTSTEQSDHKI